MGVAILISLQMNNFLVSLYYFDTVLCLLFAVAWYAVR